MIRRARFTSLAISVEHAVRAGGLAGLHRDPFDRMLMAQSQVERAPVISADPVLAAYGVEVIC